MRNTGWATRPASMLKATSSPTVSSPVDHSLGAKNRIATVMNLLIELDALAADIAQVVDTEAGTNIARQLVFPSPLHLRLDRHRLNGFDAGDALHQEGLVVGATGEFLVEAAAQHGVKPG